MTDTTGGISYPTPAQRYAARFRLWKITHLMAQMGSPFAVLGSVYLHDQSMFAVRPGFDNHIANVLREKGLTT